MERFRSLIAAILIPILCSLPVAAQEIGKSSFYVSSGVTPIGLLNSIACVGAGGCTTAAISTTGATLLVTTLQTYTENPCTGGLVTSSPSTTWACIAAYGGSTGRNTAIWYAANPTVSGSQTVTIGSSADYMFSSFSAWSNVITSSPLDVHNGATSSSASTLSTGSVTPTANNELCIAAGGGYVGYPGETSISFQAPAAAYTTIRSALSLGGTNIGGASGYSVQVSATATSTTYTEGGAAAGLAAAIACFKHS